MKKQEIKEKYVTILFGAGAEISYGISGGEKFSKTVLGITDNSSDKTIDIIKEAVSEYYKKKIKECNNKSWYPNHKITNLKIRCLIESAAKKELLINNQNLENQKRYSDLVNKKITVCSDINSKECQELLNKYASYIGIIDERFNSIIYPKLLGPKKFWFVVDSYTRAYLSIMGGLISKSRNKQLLKEDYIDILYNPSKYYNEIIEYLKKLDNEKSYYTILKKKMNSNIRVITTNYTPICSVISGIEDDKIAYVHGKLNLFEDPYNLTIYDIKKDTLPNELLFPYIFIQSGVKPIVDKTQIIEYSKMIEFLDNSKELIIVGYQLNPDDNHIVSILKDYLKSNKIIYFDFDSTGGKDISTGENDVLKRLRVSSNDNIIYEIINDKNSYSKFEEWLTKIEKSNV